MTLLLWLLVGVLLGGGTEQLVHRRRAVDTGGRSGGAGTGAAHGTPGSPVALPPVRRRRRRGRVALVCSAALLLLLVGGTVGLWLWANTVFNRIERVAVGPALRHGGRQGTNYLLVGTDNRAGVSGNRSDTILLMRVQGGRARMLSIPRDLYVTLATTGRPNRINAAYASGAESLVRTVTASLGLPVDRYLEVNFASFGPLVDSIGGVDIDFANPAFDRASGLDVKQAGRVHLDGTQALAFVRSRRYVEVVNGQERPDLTSDIGREQRQQTFMRAVLSKTGGTRNPFRLMKVASSLSEGVRIDDEMTLWNAIGLGRNMGGLNPGTEKLPVTPTTLPGGAQVLLLKQPDAEPVLAQFRT